MKYLMWLLKAAIFFTLFAFALNNQQIVAVNFFFGTAWKAHLVLVVLAAFSAGLLLGVLIMMPRWWASRNQRTKPAQHLAKNTPQSSAQAHPANQVAPVTADTVSIARHGL